VIKYDHKMRVDGRRIFGVLEFVGEDLEFAGRKILNCWFSIFDLVLVRCRRYRKM